jgi:hypothetical protein
LLWAKRDVQHADVTFHDETYPARSDTVLRDEPGHMPDPAPAPPLPPAPAPGGDTVQAPAMKILKAVAVIAALALGLGLTAATIYIAEHSLSYESHQH